MEEWKNGRLEEWKIGRLEDWKSNPSSCHKRDSFHVSRFTFHGGPDGRFTARIA